MCVLANKMYEMRMKGLLANEKHLQDAAMDEEEDDGNEDF